MNETHKVIFLKEDSLEVSEVIPVSEPFVFGTDSLKTANRGFFGIIANYIIVPIDFEGEITQEMLTDFQRDIAMKNLEKSYKDKQVSLLTEAEDFDEYLILEDQLKRLYFDVKKQILLSSTPLLVDLSLNL
jgi:hypothetical protein